MAIRREQPDSPTDFSFKIVLGRIGHGTTRTLRLDPGEKGAYDLWQEGLMRAVSQAAMAPVAK